LRAEKGAEIIAEKVVNGEVIRYNAVEEVHKVLHQIQEFSAKIRSCVLIFIANF